MEVTRRHRRRTVWVLAIGLVPALVGCHRGLYRRQADREAYYLLQEKSKGTPWEVSRGFTVDPNPESRFHDPTDPDHPVLPPAGPFLYQYQLPKLGQSRQARAEALPPVPAQPMGAPQGPAAQPAGNSPMITPPGVPSPATLPDPQRAPTTGPLGRPAWQLPAAPSQRLQAPRNQPVHGRPVYGPSAPSWVQPAAYQEAAAAAPEPVAPARDPFADVIEISSDIGLTRAQTGGEVIEIPPVKTLYWEEVPENCLIRMFEFETVRAEYADSFGKAPTADMMDDAPRLSLKDIFELALINSRDYQQQKQTLYQAALAVSLQRYDYATKFTSTGNSIDTTYSHVRSDGITNNSLRVPSTLRGSKLLATGGTLIGRFANDIVLRFNGTDGFSSFVSSDLFFSVTQSIFQRDIVLNSLIQSERNLVYAARRFARFRKQFFLDVASSYYSILRSYRGIEIDAQNYFAQVRNFQQKEEEIRAEITRAPDPISLNQFEQGVLNARSSLIRACNSLEQLLDNLKLTIGIPTETPINIDLSELERLTLRDSIEVEKERAGRWQQRLAVFRSRAQPNDLIDILNADAALAERLYTWRAMQSQLSHQTIDISPLAEQRARFRLDIARLDVVGSQARLDDATHPGENEPPAPPILVLQRQLDVISAEDILVERQGQYAERRNFAPQSLESYRQQFLQGRVKYAKLKDDIDAGLKAPRTLRVQDLLGDASMLLAELKTISQGLDQLLFGKPVTNVDMQATLAQTDQILQQTEQLFRAGVGGLPNIDISVDDAMATALVQRLDLMNERGALADDWRQIKIAADELRSVLNLNASQTLSTRQNRPFDFSFKDSQTQVGLALDLPLNRRAQRNSYRRAQLNYNTGQRDLMRFEDNTKLQIRRQMRNLAQSRDVYPISVTQAALAKEQVFSVQMQLMLGVPNVRALDLLAAFSDSREALGRVADARIGYIVERANFAFELEAIMLDDRGFWPQIDDDSYRFEPNTVYPWNAGSAYGDFPSYLKVSHELKRMLNYAPPGIAEQQPWNRFQAQPTGP